MDGNMNRAVAAIEELSLEEENRSAAERREAAERQSARIDAALQAGWAIRFDPERLEYMASRELLTSRTLDGVLDDIDAAGD